MSNATQEAFHILRCRLAADKVDSELGVIRGCTVAKAGVQAAGKFVMIDAAGAITRDESQCKKRIPVFTDEKTLETLMAAAKAAGKRVKMREDHDDSVGARAGYVSDFKRVTEADNDRVITDLHVFKSYRNRNVMIETATETPEEIGLSIDFTPEFELAGDKALMRVRELHAVDIVDEGAITPDGLLLSASVDSGKESEKPTNHMADTPTPNAEVLAAIAKMGDTICAALTKLATPPAASPKDEELKAIKGESEKLAATLKEQNEQLKAVVGTIAQLKKERALMGFRGNELDRAKMSAATAEDIEKFNADKKTYLQLVDDVVAKEKCKRSDAHTKVQATDEGKTAYALHLSAKGITGRMVA